MRIRAIWIILAGLRLVGVKTGQLGLIGSNQLTKKLPKKRSHYATGNMAFNMIEQVFQWSNMQPDSLVTPDFVANKLFWANQSLFFQQVNRLLSDPNCCKLLLNSFVVSLLFSSFHPSKTNFDGFVRSYSPPPSILFKIKSTATSKQSHVWMVSFARSVC